MSAGYIGIGGFQVWVATRWGTRPSTTDLAVMALGLSGEIGEILAACVVAGSQVTEDIKKEIRGSRPVDVEKLTLELGDVQHYLVAIANHYGIDMVDVLLKNIEKLTARSNAKGKV